MAETKSEQTKRGLAAAAAKGRRAGRKPRVSDAAILRAIPLGTARGSAKVGLSKSQFIARRKALEEKANDDGRSC